MKTELPLEREGGRGQGRGKGHELRLFKVPKKTISQILFKQRVAPQRQFLTIQQTAQLVGQQTQPMKSEQEGRLQLGKISESQEMGRTGG